MLAPGGWELESYVCRVSNVSYSWSRNDSNVAMLMAAEPRAVIDSSGDHAAFVEPIALPAGGDDAIDGIHGVRLRLLSAFGNEYNRDYRGESDTGFPRPTLNVFARRDGRIVHTYCTELAFAPSEPGMDARMQERGTLTLRALGLDDAGGRELNRVQPELDKVPA